MDALTISVVIATLAGPVLAVQAQKAVERARERHNRKLWVFQTLMATRALRVSVEHVQALNMIDVVFYGKKLFGIHRPKKTETTVIDAWHEYLDHLDTKNENPAVWAARGDDLFIGLLFALAVDVGYRFDRVRLKKGAYSPVAHGTLEQEQQQIRKLMIDTLSGNQPLKMQVTGFPVHEEALQAQLDLQAKLSAALDGRGRLTVQIMPDENQRGDDKSP